MPTLMISMDGRGGPAALVLALALLLVPSAARAQADAVFSNGIGENRVCLNDGTGVLTCSDLGADTEDSRGVALADVDGVNGIDAVFAIGIGENLVCLNDGTGALTCSDLSSDTNSSQDVALADVDGVDGIDAVFANDGEANRVCLNDGTGAFTCSDLSADTNGTSGVALADVDGVNGIDAVFANDGEANRVCLNDGTGAFTCSDLSTDTDQSSGVALADVDGVNGIDAVFANSGEVSLVCLNDGTGAFTCSDLSADTNFSNGVALADVDGVNGIDAVFAGFENQVCLNDGTGALTCSDVGFDTHASTGVALADVDGVDGMDAVFANNGVQNQVCLNDGTGAFTCSDVDSEMNVTFGVALGFLQPTDLAITKTDGKTTAVPGETLTYVIAVSNAGPAPSSATVSDVFSPEHSCAWACVGDGGATCTEGPVNGDVNDVATLPVGGVATYFAVCSVDPAAEGTLTNTATTLLPAGRFDPDTTNNTATDVDALTPQADLTITKTDGQATAAPGSSVVYVITVGNPGPSDVTGAQVSDTFSSVLSCTWTCAGRGGATCTPGPVTGDVADTVDLPAGGAIGYAAVCTIDPAATGVLVNGATVAPPAGVADPDPANNSAFDFDQLTPEADVAVTKDDGQATVVPGETTVYTIIASNPAGPSDAPGTAVSDAFSSLLDCSWSCTPSGGATCTAGPTAGDLADLADLPVGGAAEYTATCTVDSGAEGTVTNTATVTAAAGISDPSASNDTATDVDTLTPEADLAITKDDGVTSVEPGDAVTYTIVAANPGPSDALAATVEDVFPSELIDCEWSCAPAGGALCTPGPVPGDLVDSVDLPAGGSATYTASCTVDPDASVDVLENTATITEPDGVTDPTQGNNSATDVDGLPIFADGFESGDTSAWSATVP